MVLLKIIDRLKYSYLDKSFYVSVYDSAIYLINYKEIKRVSNNNLIISFEKFNLSIKGNNFKIIRKNKSDIEIYGIVNSMEFIHE